MAEISENLKRADLTQKQINAFTLMYAGLVKKTRDVVTANKKRVRQSATLSRTPSASQNTVTETVVKDVGVTKKNVHERIKDATGLTRSGCTSIPGTFVTRHGVGYNPGILVATCPISGVHLKAFALWVVLSLGGRVRNPMARSVGSCKHLLGDGHGDGPTRRCRRA